MLYGSSLAIFVNTRKLMPGDLVAGLALYAGRMIVIFGQRL
jgi:hypothetical protein